MSKTSQKPSIVWRNIVNADGVDCIAGIVNGFILFKITEHVCRLPKKYEIECVLPDFKDKKVRSWMSDIPACEAKAMEIYSKIHQALFPETFGEYPYE